MMRRSENWDCKIIFKNYQNKLCFILNFSRPDERTSFRKYASILYSNPKMKIYIENSKVRTRIMDQTLYLVRSYRFVTKSFKKKGEEDVKKAEKDVLLSKLNL